MKRSVILLAGLIALILLVVFFYSVISVSLEQPSDDWSRSMKVIDLTEKISKDLNSRLVDSVLIDDDIFMVVADNKSFYYYLVSKMGELKLEGVIDHGLKLVWEIKLSNLDDGITIYANGNNELNGFKLDLQSYEIEDRGSILSGAKRVYIQDDIAIGFNDSEILINLDGNQKTLMEVGDLSDIIFARYGDELYIYYSKYVGSFLRTFLFSYDIKSGDRADIDINDVFEDDINGLFDDLSINKDVLTLITRKKVRVQDVTTTFTVIKKVDLLEKKFIRSYHFETGPINSEYKITGSNKYNTRVILNGYFGYEGDTFESNIIGDEFNSVTRLSKNSFMNQMVDYHKIDYKYYLLSLKGVGDSKGIYMSSTAPDFVEQSLRLKNINLFSISLITLGITLISLLLGTLVLALAIIPIVILMFIINKYSNLDNESIYHIGVLMFFFMKLFFIFNYVIVQDGLIYSLPEIIGNGYVFLGLSIVLLMISDNLVKNIYRDKKFYLTPSIVFFISIDSLYTILLTLNYVLLDMLGNRFI